MILTAALTVALLAFAVAHVVLVASVARERWWQALIGVVVGPLAVYWAWEYGMRRRVFAWSLALLAYALVLTLA
jgi:hypothetical protein